MAAIIYFPEFTYFIKSNYFNFNIRNFLTYIKIILLIWLYILFPPLEFTKKENASEQFANNIEISILEPINDSFFVVPRGGQIQPSNYGEIFDQKEMEKMEKLKQSIMFKEPGTPERNLSFNKLLKKFLQKIEPIIWDQRICKIYQQS